MARHQKSPRSRRNLMVIDPLTPSQGHHFDCRVKSLSVSWATVHPLYFGIPHDHVQKINFLTPPPSTPKSKTLGHDPGDPMNIPSNMFYILFVRRHTKFGLKIFEIDLVIRDLVIFDLWPLPKAPGGGVPKKLWAVACAIHESNSYTNSG